LMKDDCFPTSAALPANCGVTTVEARRRLFRWWCVWLQESSIQIRMQTRHAERSPTGYKIQC
jgi:hypothetical protein